MMYYALLTIIICCLINYTTKKPKNIWRALKKSFNILNTLEILNKGSENRLYESSCESRPNYFKEKEAVF